MIVNKDGYNDLVSVIMPAYNCAKYIGASIESVIAQTYTNWELLITDDCSTDDTVEIIKRYAEQDKRIKLFIQERNGGAGLARNNSIEKAKGRYIAFLDSDDRWVANKLSKQISFMKEHEVVLSYSSYFKCDEESKCIGIVKCRKKVSYKDIVRNNYIGCLTIVYDSLSVGKMYMSDIRKRQDWSLSIAILKKCKVAYGLQEPLAIYRIRKNSISSNKIQLVKYNVLFYQDVFGWSRIYSFLFFLFVFMPFFIVEKIRIKYC